MKKKLFKLFMVSMLIGLIVPVIPALAASEVIHHTSFEAGDLDGWGPFGPTTLTITDEAAQDGKYSVKVTDRSANWNGIGMDVTDIFQAGGIYQGTGYFKLEQAPRGARETKITIAQENGDDAEYSNLAIVSISDDEWTKLEFEYAATGEYEVLKLYFETQEGSASFYVDNITFTMVKAPAGGYIYPEKDEPVVDEPEEPVADEPEEEEEEPVVEEPVVVVPEGPSDISRADFLVVLVNTLGLDAEFTSNFDDVKEGTFYYNAVGIARAIGLVEGIGDNKYDPDSNISTQDLMVLTVRALEKFHDLEKTDDTSVLDRFSDKDRISSYAVDSVATLAQEGFLVDIGESLDPRGNADWGLALNLLYQVSNKLAE